MGQDDQVGQGETAGLTGAANSFERLMAEDVGRERRIFWSELGVVGVMAFLLLVYLIVS